MRRGGYYYVMEKELLYRFFDGKASAEDERRVLEWLGEDPAHREELLAERRVFDALLMHAQPSGPARQTAHRGLYSRHGCAERCDTLPR